jgi:hypothetical protein
LAANEGTEVGKLAGAVASSLRESIVRAVQTCLVTLEQ